MKARPKGLRADAMPESAGSNYAVQKTLHKCCAAASYVLMGGITEKNSDVPCIFERLRE